MTFFDTVLNLIEQICFRTGPRQLLRLKINIKVFGSTLYESNLIQSYTCTYGLSVASIFHSKRTTHFDPFLHNHDF